MGLDNQLAAWVATRLADRQSTDTKTLTPLTLPAMTPRVTSRAFKPAILAATKNVASKAVIEMAVGSVN